ncbi:Inversin [Strongyloides ratti]|uniref:Inversin n=1 Tax=Strongyloides ratti TaxID=34506 RepID=A0A090L6E4_STRRB|nr:Inversin [Strongyloides ratti]CEF65302.1 Inversin [Strongyloides ratti]
MHNSFTTNTSENFDNKRSLQLFDFAYLQTSLKSNDRDDEYDTINIVNHGDTLDVDGNNKELLLSYCSSLYKSSFLYFFIYRNYQKSVVFKDPFKLESIIDLSFGIEEDISNLLYDYKLSLIEKVNNMTSSNIDSTFLNESDFFEKACATISLDDHYEFEKILKIPLFENIINTKDSQGRSLLILSCMADKPKIAGLLLKKGLSIDDKDYLGRNSLYWSVKCESIKTLKWMLNQLSMTEDLILSKDNNKITTLHVAATKKSAKVLRLLLNALPNKNEELLEKIYDNYNRIPLHYAAASGSLECVEEFMDESLNLPVSLRDMYGNTSLMLACGNNCASEVVRYLSTKKSISITSRNCAGMSPLHIAVLANNIDCVKILLQECKISTEIYDEDARTPLHYAAQNGRVEIVELLLEAGARYNAVDEYRATPTHYAAEINWDIVKLLLDKSGFNYCGMIDKEGRTPFMWAVASENTNVISKMLKYCDIPRHGSDFHKYTALHIAAFTGNVSICKMLMQQGWVVTAEDKAGATPLHIAAGKGYTNLVQIFCTSDDIINKVDTNLRTALFYAALGGQAHTLNVMISDLGFDIGTEDILDRTVLHAAAYCGFVACVQKLIEHGVDINAIDRDEETPLHVACSRGKEDVVHLLVLSGAIINPYSRINETTPLSYAIANNQTEIIQFLKDRNAVTGEEIKNIAAYIITRAIRQFIIKKQRSIFKTQPSSLMAFFENFSITDSRISCQSSSKGNLSQVINRSPINSQIVRTSFRSQLSSQSVNRIIFNDETLNDTNND